MSHPTPVRPTRRQLVQGAAWSVPVVALASAAPAHAASPIPLRGMNGWVLLTRQSCTFSIDGRGNFTGGGSSDRGIWTFVDDPDAEITGGVITFFFNRSNLSFSGGSNGWSALVRDTAKDAQAPATGYYAYTTTYNGGWRYEARYGAWVATGQPYFTSTIPSRCNDGIRGYARRTLTVNGETVTFTRGPVSV